MPLIDFPALRARLKPVEVARLLGLVAVEVMGRQRRGPCPLHQAQDRRRRCFGLNLDGRGWACSLCGERGDLLRLYCLVSGLAVYPAALELCRRLGVEVPTFNHARKRRGGGGH